VLASDENTIRGNNINDNLFAGIWFASWLDVGLPMPANNVIHANTATGNGAFDLGESEAFTTTFEIPGPPLDECFNVWKSNNFDAQHGPLNCID
jgi:hypothetical protein